MQNMQNEIENENSEIIMIINIIQLLPSAIIGVKQTIIIVIIMIMIGTII